MCSRHKINMTKSYFVLLANGVKLLHNTKILYFWEEISYFSSTKKVLYHLFACFKINLENEFQKRTYSLSLSFFFSEQIYFNFVLS